MIKTSVKEAGVACIEGDLEQITKYIKIAILQAENAFREPAN